MIFGQITLSEKNNKIKRYVAEFSLHHFNQNSQPNKQLVEERILDINEENWSPDKCVLSIIREGSSEEFKSQDLWVTGTVDGFLRIYENIPENTSSFPKVKCSQVRMHKGKIRKISLVKDKEKSLIITLGKDGNVCILM